MVPSWAPYALAGLAATAPVLLFEADKAGIVVQFRATAGQRAALGVMDRPLLGVTAPASLDQSDKSALSRWLQWMNQLGKSRGFFAQSKAIAKLSEPEAHETTQRVLDAFEAGVAASDEAYDSDRAASLAAFILLSKSTMKDASDVEEVLASCVKLLVAMDDAGVVRIGEDPFPVPANDDWAGDAADAIRSARDKVVGALGKGAAEAIGVGAKAVLDLAIAALTSPAGIVAIAVIGGGIYYLVRR